MISFAAAGIPTIPQTVPCKNAARKHKTRTSIANSHQQNGVTPAQLAFCLTGRLDFLECVVYISLYLHVNSGKARWPGLSQRCAVVQLMLCWS